MKKFITIAKHKPKTSKKKEGKILMLIDEIKDRIREEPSFDVYDVEYKRAEDKEKYGTSFDTYLNNKDFIFIKVNGGTFKVKRICEEFGRILFIYNGEQVSYNPKDITEITFPKD